MNYIGFNPDSIKERLQKQLRDDHGSSGSRFFALARRSALPLLRGAGLTKDAI